MSLIPDSAHDVMASISDALKVVSDPGAVQFWWRDDDAETSSPALDRLLALSESIGVPVGLAVIPGHLKPSLTNRLAKIHNIDVFAHGWTHKNHAQQGELASEYPRSRHVEDVRDELSRSLAVLREGFPDNTLPVFVPPWNRLAPEFEGVLVECGYRRLSAASGNHQQSFGADGLRRAHGDLNVISTPKTRLGADIRGLALVAKSIRAGGRGPFGVVTHHKLFDDATWRLCQEFWTSLMSFACVKTFSARQVFCAE